MNLANLSSLVVTPESGTWFRIVKAKHILTILNTTHSRGLASRFGDGQPLPNYVDILYFADHPLTAMYEVSALFGPNLPGGPVPNSRASSVHQSFTLSLTAVARLEDLASQNAIDISAQELTGDWEGYHLRNSATRVTQPTGIAPTQVLGRAMHAQGSLIEGFTFVSAKLSTARNIAIFPANMLKSSFIEFDLDDGKGPQRVYGSA